MNQPKLLAAAAIAFAGSLHAQVPQAPPAGEVDPLLLPYAKPDRLAKLPDGRTIHLKCMGSGSPTVILTAGLGESSETWRKVQPTIAKTTRVCGWDRPGFGFSSGSLQPQTAINVTRDLEAALRSAKLKGPYVLVGHSLGSFETLLFKDRNPRSVRGMVLVDPSIPDQDARFARVAPALSRYSEEQSRSGLELLRSCAADIRSGELSASSADPKGCLKPPPTYPPQMIAAMSKLDWDPARWSAAISLIDNVGESMRSIVNPGRNYGSMPLIVLTATKPRPLPKEAPQAAKDGVSAQDAEWIRGHDELARLSTRGENRLVPDSAHHIQWDRPDLVIAAIHEVLTSGARYNRAADRRTAKSP